MLSNANSMRSAFLLTFCAWVGCLGGVDCFLAPNTNHIGGYSAVGPVKETRQSNVDSVEESSCRRKFIVEVPLGVLSSFVLPLSPAKAEGDRNFAPGGTLVDYEVGVTVGNSEASPMRKPDNSNVIFAQDFYFKFGTAPPWIVDDSFPKTMPFTPSQQRYDALKKYGDRVRRGFDAIGKLRESIDNDDSSSIADASDPVYSVRPMGLLANNFLASENTGTTNELLLARWFINEIFLDLDDVKNAPNKIQRSKSYVALVKATNSYIQLLNRVITPKVGDKFPLLEPY